MGRCSEPGKDGVAVETKQTKIGGFSGVLGPKADNKEVFERVFQPSLERVANGGTASLFCYDYDKRDLETETTVQERKESIAINKSLLALKECFRSIGSGKTSSRACFRGSSLTRVLEDALLPSSSSLRRGRDCRSVMVVNVSPSARIEKRTLNVLRYGQMFSDSTKAKKTSKKKAI